MDEKLNGILLSRMSECLPNSVNYPSVPLEYEDKRSRSIIIFLWQLKVFCLFSYLQNGEKVHEVAWKAEVTMEYDRHRGRVAAKYVKDNLLACVDLQGNEDESRIGERSRKRIRDNKVPLNIREQVSAIRSELMLRTCSWGRSNI